MSTPPVTQPTAVNPNELSPEQIASQLAAQVAPATNPPAVEPMEREFVRTLDTGQTYRGKTKDELIEQLARAQESASKRITELSNKTPAPVVPVVTPTEPTFDQNKYYQLLAENPIQAQSYAFQFTPEAIEVRRNQDEQSQFIQGLRLQAEVNKFKADTPDLPLDDSSTALFEAEWNKFGLPITATNLKLVHSHCVANKVYAPASQQVSNVVTQTPLPTLSTPAAGQATQQVDPNTMTTEQLAAYIKQLNGQ